MKHILVFFILTVLVSCTSRKAPAPIMNIENTSSVYKQSGRKIVNAKQYKVKKGETLYSIAWRAGVDFRHLAQINSIPKPYNIFPGQVLNLASTRSALARNKPNKQPVNQLSSAVKNGKKTVANAKSGEYGKKQLRDQKSKTTIKKDPFPSKVRSWRYPSEGKIIESYSTRENGNNGLDFSGKTGDPVIAAADGKVVYAGSALRGYGNLIIVKHNNDYLSAYAHNRTLKVKERDWVKAGQKIAEMGDSGTDKVKLHFEIRFRGRSVNPLKYLPKRS